MSVSWHDINNIFQGENSPVHLLTGNRDRVNALDVASLDLLCKIKRKISALFTCILCDSDTTLLFKLQNVAVHITS